MPHPYGGVPTKSRRGDPCGRPERRGRRSLRFLFWSTPPHPVGAIHESPAAAMRRDFRCHPASAGGSMPRPYVVSESRRGDPCGRQERRGRRSLRVSFRSTPPQPVGAIHESPAAPPGRKILAPSLRGLSALADWGSVPAIGATPPPTSLRSATSPYGGGKNSPMPGASGGNGTEAVPYGIISAINKRLSS